MSVPIPPSAVHIMKVIKLPIIPRRYAVSFCGLILCKDSSWIDKYVQNHEKIHLRQQQEMLFIPFFIAYLIEIAYKCIKHRSFHKGYMDVSHEKEAYAHEKDLSYLKKRKHFAQYRNATALKSK